MDDRLTTIVELVEQLSKDLASLEKALGHTQELLKALVKEVRKNGKTQKEATVVTQRFLASQQPRWRFMEDDDHD